MWPKLVVAGLNDSSINANYFQICKPVVTQKLSYLNFFNSWATET